MRFKDNIEIQKKITELRLQGFSVKEIVSQVPEYSEITYKRFFSKNKIKFNHYKTEKFKNKQRESQKKSWENKDLYKKNKHIEHLRKLNNDLQEKLFTERLGKTFGKWKIIGGTANTPLCECSCGTQSYVKFYDMLYEKTLSCGCSAHFSSKGEAELRDFIETELGLETFRRRKNKYEIDIYIPSLNIGIEYNGLYWHSEINVPKLYYLNKMKKAQEEGINLIQIFEHEWLLAKDKVKVFLTSKLKRNTTKIHARNCFINELKEEDAKDFANNYHIQGFKKSIKYFGLFFKDELVGMASFGNHHRGLKRIVLNRLVFKRGVSVRGGISKISNYASNYFKQDIYTWCDLRLSNGESYIKGGWVLDGILPPDYFYITKGGLKIFSKQSRKKSKTKTLNNTTELEQAKKDGLIRVWDCGKKRFVFKYTKRP